MTRAAVHFGFFALLRVPSQTVRALLVLMLLTLAACSGAQPQAPAATPQPAPAVSVTLFLWHAWSSEQALTLSRLIDTYNGGQSRVRILPQRVAIASMADDIRAASQAGSGPHLMLLPSRWVGTLASDGILLPLDDYVAADEQRRLLPAAVAGVRHSAADGQIRLYGLPVSVDTLALFYNRENFPEPPADTTTMLNAARALSDPLAVPPRWGLAYNLSLDATIGYLYAFGGRVYDEKGQVVLDSSGRLGAEQWLEWTADLSRDPNLLAVPDGVRVSQEVAARQALMTIDWAHNLDTYQRLWGDQLGVAPLPTLSDTRAAPTPYVVAEVAAINTRASAAEHQAAVEFVRFLLSEPAQQQLWQAGRLPALSAIAADAQGWPRQQALLALHTQAQHGLPALNVAAAPTVERILRQMQRDVLRGLVSPSDAVTGAAAALRALTPSLPKQP